MARSSRSAPRMTRQRFRPRLRRRCACRNAGLRARDARRQDLQARICQPANRSAGGLLGKRRFHNCEFPEHRERRDQGGQCQLSGRSDREGQPVQIRACASDMAGDLIASDKIDLMLVASTPETTNPVASRCEAQGTPCLSTVAPWQPYFIGRQSNPGESGLLEAVRLYLSFLLGARRRHRGLHQHVGTARYRQVGRRPVPQ